MRAVLVNSVYEDDNVFRQRSRCVVCVELTGGVVWTYASKQV